MGRGDSFGIGTGVRLSEGRGVTVLPGIGVYWTFEGVPSGRKVETSNVGLSVPFSACAVGSFSRGLESGVEKLSVRSVVPSGVDGTLLLAFTVSETVGRTFRITVPDSAGAVNVSSVIKSNGRATMLFIPKDKALLETAGVFSQRVSGTKIRKQTGQKEACSGISAPQWGHFTSFI